MLLILLTVIVMGALFLAAPESLRCRGGWWQSIIEVVNGKHTRLDALVASLFIIANVGTVAVWSLIAANPQFLESQASIICVCLALYGGGFVSVIGLPVSVVCIFCRQGVARWLWATSAPANAAGIIANIICFVIYIAPGC